MPSCVLIGADALLTQCGELLLTRGWTIKAVVTDAAKVTRWASGCGLVNHTTNDYRAALASTDFDVLFAITHLQLLPDDVLRAPKLFAVNFHDGPLPHFSGLNAPAWALLAGEREYGVTWHVITPEVDAGDVLKTRVFEVSERETSLSLNTRNFEAALDSFAELLVELEQHTFTRTPQDRTAVRRVFARADRPKNMCVLEFDADADAVDAVVRALDFGRYNNALGAAKVVVGDRAIVVQRAELREGIDAAAGTVVSLSANELVVQCRRGAVALSAMTSLAGVPLTVSAAAASLGIKQGGVLSPSSDAVRAARTTLGAVLARDERAVLAQLTDLLPIELPYAATHSAAATPISARVSIAVDAQVVDVDTGVCAAFACALARLSGKWRFHIAINHAATDALVTPWSPLLLSVERDATLQDLALRLRPALERARGRQGFLSDLVGRSPALAAHVTLASGAALPVAVCFGPRALLSGTVAQLELNSPVGVGGAQVAPTLHYDASRLSAADAAMFAGQVSRMFAQSVRAPKTTVGTLDLLDDATRELVLSTWNQTQTPVDAACVHHLIEARADQHPERIALVCADETLSYAQLEQRANSLAAHLVTLGVASDVLVGVFVPRSVDLVVAAHAVHKAGGAYVPLDPNYPTDRIAHMIADSACPVVLTTQAFASSLPPTQARIVCVDGEWQQTLAPQTTTRVRAATQPQHLAYCIYTSGTTGKPKGVLVEHRNVVNFFCGMDLRINPADHGAVWCAVTSLSFDISVLELFYTLARGFTVVVYQDQAKQVAAITKPHVDFSLFYFSGDEEQGRGSDKYRLLLDGARYADANGFVAVWTPERHFHAFGGLYPNPAVTGAAVAAITKHVQIRAGSVVLPLHHPIEVAESWSVVDNISDGRVGISFASGWQPNDFVLRPHNFKIAKDVMFRDIETVRRLWKGESVSFPGATDAAVSIKTLPRPVQAELPVWVTTAGNPETYVQAGKIGAHLLTHLLGQTPEQLAPKIALYRRARADAGHDPDAGIVSLMLHTFVGDSDAQVRARVREPLKQYLGTSMSLLKQYAWAFPAFQKPAGADASGGDEFANLSAEEHDAVLEYAYQRYYDGSGLFGTVDHCVAFVDRLSVIGVSEIACLIDFGVDTGVVLEHLPRLDAVRRRCARAADATLAKVVPDVSMIPEGVTHLQCTPSMAQMFLAHPQTRRALSTVKHIMVGGEGFPIALAKELTALQLQGGRVTNMYGPTETTIWSTTWDLDGALDTISIGTPIANTSVYILDAQLRPLPPGVAGEMWIGGDGVVRGYHQRAELTAERFVRDPFRPSVANARMYKTGDLAKWRALGDGSARIEFLGRIDHQVKLRGYRIELGEIEAQLSQHPHVHECVVALREPMPGDQQLVAYCSAKQGVRIDGAAVKEHLRRSLPQFMVPAHVVQLAELPHTPNGKIDRNALPTTAPSDVQAAHAVVAAQNATEQHVLAVWKEVLGRDEISVEDNFFDIGGHSLLVVRAHRRLVEVLDKPVSLTDLYRFPTVRALSAFLADDSGSAVLKKSAERGTRRKELQRRRGGST